MQTQQPNSGGVHGVVQEGPTSHTTTCLSSQGEKEVGALEIKGTHLVQVEVGLGLNKPFPQSLGFVLLVLAEE